MTDYITRSQIPLTLSVLRDRELIFMMWINTGHRKSAGYAWIHYALSGMKEDAYAVNQTVSA
jgi:hypothetical protein